jgi:hypothetical protein
MAEIAKFEETRRRFVYVSWLNVHVNNLQAKSELSRTLAKIYMQTRTCTCQYVLLAVNECLLST